jgi:hypothetical protein
MLQVGLEINYLLVQECLEARRVEDGLFLGNKHKHIFHFLFKLLGVWLVMRIEFKFEGASSKGINSLKNLHPLQLDSRIGKDGRLIHSLVALSILVFSCFRDK